MKKFGIRFVALLLSLTMVMSISSCSMLSDLFGGGTGNTRTNRYDDDDDDDDDDGTTATTVDPDDLPKLTYPDHIATVDEIHPSRANGTVKGSEASKLLKDVEKSIIGYFINDYVSAEIYFEHPEEYGIDVDNVSWGEVSSDDEETLKFVKEQLEKLYSVDRDSLSKDDKIFYDKVVWDLEEEAYADKFTAFDYYEGLNPLTGIQTEIFFLLDILEFDTKEDVENYLTLLKDLDRFFDEICDFEERRAAYGYGSGKDIYEQNAETFDNLVKTKNDCFLYDTFKTRLDKVSGLSDSEKKDFISRNEDLMKDVVFPEFKECAKRMRALAKNAGSSRNLTEIEHGDEYYAIVFRSQTNSGKTVKESLTELENVINSVMSTYRRIIQSSNTSWQGPYLSHSYSKGDTQKNLDFLKNAIANDFPVLHEHSYRLSEVPEALEEDFSPAAYIGYHLDNYHSNLIIVNNSNVDDDFGVTVAHEGYPGHMFQSVYTRSHTEHPYMYLCDSIGYAEGWAVYSETYSMKYFDSNNTVRTVVQIEDELNDLLFARLDIGIHYEGWSIDDCASYLSNLYGKTIKTSQIQKMYDILISDPGYGVKYGVGFVNTGLIIQEAKDKFKDATDLQIHTAYLNASTGTFEQIKSNMFEELGG